MTANEKTEPITKEEWQQRLENYPIKHSDMNRLIMNYFITEGFKEAAEKFQNEAGLEPCVDLNSLDDRIMIREAVQHGRIQEAIHLVNELHPELLDDDRYLFFHLQQLQLIELIRANHIEEALSFAQNHLSEAGEEIPEALAELERTLALMAFEKPQNSPFSDLLEQAHRQKIASELNAAILKCEQSTETTPKIIYLLKMILWAQSKLDSREYEYPKMVDLENARIESK